jgi:hypothetical protein
MRDTRIAALELAELEYRRAKYERRGDEVKLRQLEERFNKAERLRMYMRVTAQLRIFGTARDWRLYQEWYQATEAGDWEKLGDIDQEIRAWSQRLLGEYAADWTFRD